MVSRCSWALCPKISNHLAHIAILCIRPQGSYTLPSPCVLPKENLFASVGIGDLALWPAYFCLSPVPCNLGCHASREPEAVAWCGGGRDESMRRGAGSQWIVAARPLCHLQCPVAYLSRLQRIQPAAREEGSFEAACHGSSAGQA